MKKIIEMIEKREILELSARDEDITLSGLFEFLKEILKKFPHLYEIYKDKQKFLKYLIHDCLFDKEQKSLMLDPNTAKPPKCKNLMTRDHCLKLIMEIVNDNEEGLQILVKYLKSYICESFWRTPRKADW